MTNYASSNDNLSFTAQKYALFYRFSEETNIDLSCCALSLMISDPSILFFFALRNSGRTLSELLRLIPVDFQVPLPGRTEALISNRNVDGVSVS
jgi:hypothetical protein